jgi:outer membrane protein OmpA-like peptidoglycan-associated protein
MTESTSINAEGQGYRRGVIFGLTMAEVLLLLIFCLLLFLKLINDRLEEAEKKRDEFSVENAELEKEVSVLKEDLSALETYLATTESLSDQSTFIQQIIQSAKLLEVYELEKTSELSKLLKEDPRALRKLKIATDEQWADLTTKAQFNVSEEVHKTLSALSEEQLQNLLKNADIAATTSPLALREIVKKAQFNVSEEVHQTLSALSEEQVQNLLENADIAANTVPSALQDLTTKEQFNVSEELYQTLSALNEEQVQNLMSNADIAANTPPSALQDMTSKPAPPTPDESYRDELAAQVTIDELEKLAAGRMTEEGNNWPPIISLPDAENFSFEVGSAKLTDGFKVQLRSNIADQILETLQQYDADVIEVIGHTDLQRMRQEIRTTNLDAEALRFFTSDNDFTLRAKDNAGLGYARALSVTKQLKNIPELSDYTILPYSGAQLISPDETINLNPDQFDSSQLRRIEIRVRRKNSNN